MRPKTLATKEKILWGILIASVVVNLLASITKLTTLDFLNYLTPVILLVTHACWFLGWKRGMGFLLVPALTGAIFELIGLKYGVFFGGYYIYRPQTYMLWGLPLIVPIYWSVFIYFSYWFINSFLVWLHQPQPTKKNNSFWLVVLLTILDALVVVSIDMPLDPISVADGNWQWLNSGEYFGIPIGNFVGWFTVAAIASLIIRTWEFFFPRLPQAWSRNIYLLPVTGYALLGISLMIVALKLMLPQVVLIAIMSMVPILLANVLVRINSSV